MIFQLKSAFVTCIIKNTRTKLTIIYRFSMENLLIYRFNDIEIKELFYKPTSFILYFIALNRVKADCCMTLAMTTIFSLKFQRFFVYHTQYEKNNKFNCNINSTAFVHSTNEKKYSREIFPIQFVSLNVGLNTIRFAEQTTTNVRKLKSNKYYIQPTDSPFHHSFFVYTFVHPLLWIENGI